MRPCLLALALLLLGSELGLAATSADDAPGVIVDQNLFHPSRSVPPPPPPPKPVPVATPAPPAPPPPPKFELSGVVKAEGVASMAVLQEPQLTQGKPQIVSLGQPVGPYKLTAVEDDRVRLEAEGRTVTVLLHDPTKTPKAPAPPLTASPGVPPGVQRVGPPGVQRAVPPGVQRRARVGPGGPAVLDGPAGGDEEQAQEASPEPMQPGAIMGIFEKAFGAFTGSGRLPLLRGQGRPRGGQDENRGGQDENQGQ